MAVNLIKYDEQRHKVALPITSREEYLKLRNTQAQLNHVAAARRGDDAAKRRLLQMNYSLVTAADAAAVAADAAAKLATFPLRGASTVGNSVGMDIDHLDAATMQNAIAKVLQLKEELGLLMLERSARGEGLHVVFRRHPDMNNEDNLRWASNLLGVEFDKGAKDVTRVFYTTTASADDLLFLDDAIFCRDVVQDVNGDCFGSYTADTKGDNNIVAPDVTPVASDAIAPNTTESIAPNDPENTTYLGIPYADIIQKYWDMFYNGVLPVKSNRDSLTFELANVMKHICGFDRNLLQQVIPCYDGFAEEEKLKCIDSALNGKRTQMPKRLRDVLEALRRQQLIDEKETDTQQLAAFDEVLSQDELFYYNRMPKGVMVQGVKESIEAAGHQLVMPTIAAICPAIGARATGVMLDVHGKANTLNLISYIAGDFASGKGQMDDVVRAWMSEDIAMADMYNRQWMEWKRSYKRNQNKKELPEEPKLPKVWLTLNNTTANLADELANVEGRHAFSFTPEADVVSQKWKSDVGDFSTMIRVSYDASSYDREARSVDAVNVHIPRLLWNVVMCGTPDALYRVVRNYTDGFQSRIAVARTPDNTFKSLEENPPHLTDYQKEKIEQVSHLLPLMKGLVRLPKLEARGREWLEEILLETIKDNDRVMARQRFRICVTAQRMTCCLMLAGVCAKLIKDHGVTGAESRLRQDPSLWIKMTETMQTPAFLEMYGIIADSLIDNAMYFFRDRIEDAFNSRSYGGSNKPAGLRSRKGKNDTIYSRLPQLFSFNEAMAQSQAVKDNVTYNAVQQMLKNWDKQGLIDVIENGSYRKKG